MRVLAFRTFIGSCATLVSSVVNLTVLMAVGGEPGWMCLMLCNADSTNITYACCQLRLTDEDSRSSVLRLGPSLGYEIRQRW